MVNTPAPSVDELLQIAPPPKPGDFDAFWRTTFEENARVPLKVEWRPSSLDGPGHDIYEIEFDSLGKVRIGGWLLVPKALPVKCGFVISHGYGGRQGPELTLLRPDAAAIFPCARGFNRSRHEQIPCSSERHVLHGIQSRDSYVHRGCVCDVWSATSALLAVVPPAARRLFYVGCSFGGGIGALALPWDARFKKAQLSVPSFGHHPLRLQTPCSGSGESVRRYHARNPQVIEVLRYFDSASAAALIRIPTLVAPAKVDPAVPPVGQFAVYNALPGPKELFVYSAGHMEFPEAQAEDSALREKARQWFAE